MTTKKKTKKTAKKKTPKKKTELPVWAQIHISMIETCAEAFHLCCLPADPDPEDALGFFIMEHRDTSAVGYSIRWGQSRWVYTVMTSSTMEIWDAEKGLDKADCQPQFSDDPKALTAFLVEATKLWVETGHPLHFHCGACEEETHANTHTTSEETRIGS